MVREHRRAQSIDQRSDTLELQAGSGKPAGERRQAVSAVAFEDLLQARQVLAIREPHGEGEERRRQPGKARRTAMIPQGHSCVSLRRAFPAVDRLHGERPLRGAHIDHIALDEEVAAFFGSAQPWHFTAVGETVDYTGPNEWSYRRFILHQAHLCALAGGVDAFCIGSEMVGLTQARDGAASYPFVAGLADLASQARTILGPGTRIGGRY